MPSSPTQSVVAAPATQDVVPGPPRFIGKSPAGDLIDAGAADIIEPLELRIVVP